MILVLYLDLCLLSMGIIKGDILKIEADGEDEKIAVNALIRLIKNMEK